jgi:hypothetical protein
MVGPTTVREPPGKPLSVGYYAISKDPGGAPSARSTPASSTRRSAIRG